jgi:hypothetical protein
LLALDSTPPACLSRTEIEEGICTGPDVFSKWAIINGNIAGAAVESQQDVAITAPATPATSPTPSNPATRSEAAKANIKEGLRQHAIAGRPTKAQLILVFGTKGYAMTWAQRTERFGITPETFQSALVKGVPAIRLGPGAQTTLEKAKEKGLFHLGQ